MKYSEPMKAILSRTEEKLHPNPSRAIHSRAAIAGGRSLLNAVASLEKMAATRKPSQTPEMHTVAVAKASRQLSEKTLSMINRLAADMRESEVTFAAEADKAAGIIPNHLASEIRQAFRAMDSKERSEAVTQALSERNGAVFHALRESPTTLLHGIPQDLIHQHVDTLRRLAAPELVMDHQLFNETAESMLTLFDVAQKAVNEGFDPVKLKQITDAEAEADQLHQNFAEAIA